MSQDPHNDDYFGTAPDPAEPVVFGDAGPLDFSTDAREDAFGQPAGPAAEHPESTPGSFAAPSYPAPFTTSAASPVPPRPPRRRGLMLAGAASLGLTAAGAAAAFVLLNGGGPQPEQYVPADALAFAKVDLDPAADQKIAALRFIEMRAGDTRL